MIIITYLQTANHTLLTFVGLHYRKFEQKDNLKVQPSPNCKVQYGYLLTLQKNRYGQIEVMTKKAFQMKANRPLCVCDWGPQENNFETVHLLSEGVPSVHVVGEGGIVCDREAMTDQWQRVLIRWELHLPPP